MKTLNTYINEWRANTNTVSHIKKQNLQYFIYKNDEKSVMSIFDKDWPQFKYYKDKVYIDGEQVTIGSDGWTVKQYEKGIYEIEIKDINNITNCYKMFNYCYDLISVPWFDTSKVKNMSWMFAGCQRLEEISLFDTSNVENMRAMFCGCKTLVEIPLFDTSKVKDMDGMFYAARNLKNVPLFNMNEVVETGDMFKNCENLSEQTKKEWSQIYNFETHNNR